MTWWIHIKKSQELGHFDSTWNNFFLFVMYIGKYNLRKEILLSNIHLTILKTLLTFSCIICRVQHYIELWGEKRTPEKKTGNIWNMALKEIIKWLIKWGIKGFWKNEGKIKFWRRITDRRHRLVGHILRHTRLVNTVTEGKAERKTQ